MVAVPAGTKESGGCGCGSEDDDSGCGCGDKAIDPRGKSCRRCAPRVHLTDGPGVFGWPSGVWYGPSGRQTPKSHDAADVSCPDCAGRSAQATGHVQVGATDLGPAGDVVPEPGFLSRSWRWRHRCFPHTYLSDDWADPRWDDRRSIQLPTPRERAVVLLAIERTDGIHNCTGFIVDPASVLGNDPYGNPISDPNGDVKIVTAAHCLGEPGLTPDPSQNIRIYYHDQNGNVIGPYWHVFAAHYAPHWVGPAGGAGSWADKATHDWVLLTTVITLPAVEGRVGPVVPFQFEGPSDLYLRDVDDEGEFWHIGFPQHRNIAASPCDMNFSPPNTIAKSERDVHLAIDVNRNRVGLGPDKLWFSMDAGHGESGSPIFYCDDYAYDCDPQGVFPGKVAALLSLMDIAPISGGLCYPHCAGLVGPRFTPSVVADLADAIMFDYPHIPGVAF